MDMNKIITALKEDIIQAFIDTPHPGSPEKICFVPCCPDHDATAEWSSHHTWEDLARDLETLDYEPLDWFFYHPEGFHYFLPGAILFIIQNLSRDPEDDSWGTRVWRPLDWVRSTIVPTGYSGPENDMERKNEFRSQYLPLFSIDQRKIIIRVLDFFCSFAFISDDSNEETISDIKSAIREIWSCGLSLKE
jgi:hypothetical protein